MNESQNRTKRAPFTDELMSKHPRKRETTPSPTHTGQPFRAGFHRGTKVSSSEKLKESFILQEKQGRQEKPPGRQLGGEGQLEVRLDVQGRDGMIA